MPVLSESNSFKQGKAPCSRLSMIGAPHILAAFVLLSCIFVVIRRRRAQKAHSLVAAQGPETDYQFRNEKIGKDFEFEYQDPRMVSMAMMMPRPPTTAAFASPTLDETNETNVRNLESVPASPIALSSQPPATTFDEFETALKIEIPRRRSYTKTIGGMKGGNELTEVTGEILVSPEGWRRHTRVFGGGVCKACEESERRMSA